MARPPPLSRHLARQVLHLVFLRRVAALSRLCRFFKPGPSVLRRFAACSINYSFIIHNH